MLNFFSLPYLLPINSPMEPPAIVEEVRPTEPEVKLIFYPVPKWALSSCVEFAKQYLGHSGEIWGNAKNMKSTFEKPYAGGLVLTKEGKGHVAVILKVASSSIDIIEANYIPNKVSTRSMSLENNLIRGFK